MRPYYKTICMIIGAWGLLIAFTMVVFAQGGIAIESKVDRSKIFIGDVIKYSLILTHDADVKVKLPSSAANLGQFEIRDYKIEEPSKQRDKIVTRAEYLISTFEIGEFVIPPLSVEYFVGADTTARVIKTEPIKIEVRSLNPSETGDIRDIKPPVTPPRDWRRIIFTSVGFLLLIAAVALTLWYLKRRRQGKSLLPMRKEPPRPPHELALEALQHLVESDYLATGKIKDYHSELADILRRYLEGRFFVDAMELTTDEVLAALEQDRVDEDIIDQLQAILRPCDLVKFAKYIPEADEIQRITHAAFDFVHKTKLVLEEEKQPETTATSESLSTVTIDKEEAR